MKKVLTCVGTRPNIIKITQLHHFLANRSDIEYKVLHTGQHFDYNMSAVFFQELGLKEPDIFLNAVGKSSDEVVGDITIKFREFLESYRPDLIIVPGDVNSSYVCALVASELNISVAHIESGLRSFDLTMPEEVNRIAIDKMAQLCFVTEQSGLDNLENEKKHQEAIYFVGNTMIDTLVAEKDAIAQSNIRSKLNLKNGEYVLLTFHRPMNVDFEEQLTVVCELIRKLSELTIIAFPIHPRTLKQLHHFNLYDELSNENIVKTEPLGYLDFMKLATDSSLIVTDSGGIQEESTYLNVPCLTVRPNTERPVTITEGTNELIELDIDKLVSKVESILGGKYKKGAVPKYWDGKSSEKIANHIINYLQQ
ncbi:MAG: UDP-N-acetylglucosamine 2-epimerase (non-hydrolyzing) [Bacteroidetes bacterium]|nr:MAG: UDP-N-acetylglucosamine 2-epimerase (non-hydrolyzing) [Bacteroidota bacterium]